MHNVLLPNVNWNIVTIVIVVINVIDVIDVVCTDIRVSFTYPYTKHTLIHEHAMINTQCWYLCTTTDIYSWGPFVK